jgi:hypothetical protein
MAALAAIVWPSGTDEGCLMAAYTAYYDASGVENTSGFLVVVGVVAEASKWTAKFEPAWQRVLDKYDITFHHHKQYVQDKGEYAKWKGNHPDRTEYLKDLIRAHKRGVQNTFIVSVPDDAIRAVIERYQGFFDSSGRGAYALASNTCLGLVNQWVRTTKAKGSTVHHVFEDGDTGQELLDGLIRVRLSRKFDDQWGGYSVVPKKDTHGRYIHPFEASDLGGWEFRRVLVDISGGVKRKPRTSALEIGKQIPTVGVTVTKKRLLEIAAKGAPYFRRKDQ